MERNRVNCEYEAMLNSRPGKGIIDTGWAKMMMGSDTFRQYLDLLSPKERASIEQVREKSRFRFGDNEKSMSHWSAIIPMSVGKHVCREKVAIVLGDAPLLISTLFLQRMGAVLDLEKGQVTFKSWESRGATSLRDFCCVSHRKRRSCFRNPVSRRGDVQKACWSKREFAQQKQVLEVRNRECSRRKTVLTFER